MKYLWPSQTTLTLKSHSINHKIVNHYIKIKNNQINNQDRSGPDQGWSQRPRTDLNKRFLHRPKTTTA